MLIWCMSLVAWWMKASRRYLFYKNISDSLNVTKHTTPLPQRLSFTRAKELSAHVARLPIDEYMVKKENKKNFHSKILAINQGGSEL